MHWRLKGLVQKTLGVVPGGEALHYRLQRRYGGLQNFRKELATKVEDWQIMVRHLRDARMPISGSHFFEIGTGWYPTFPFALYLAGARRITTYDLNHHLQDDLVRAAVQELGGFLKAIAEDGGSQLADVEARYRKLAAAVDTGADLGEASGGTIRYSAPADATATSLADGEVDVVFSNSVLEHVPPDAITAMYRESMRVLRPGGVMFHSVNCGDHYAYVDRKVNQLNYLCYSDRAWRFWNNAFLYQNRLRAHVFVDAAREAGFAIDLDTSNTRPERLQQLRDMRVHPQFAQVPAEQLCITTVDFIARKPG
ncbi:class I SAM-dependent methyltransferase [Lysobacter sp. M2-1]|uniref:class I SAM-dependent methyltransferase n=1 Tax=Lysobacter sp. M2-1 TaxID=2916839 RepID=UPI001F599025|nr:class I SAM-dependent methyltransferase [Lysobacter sp. M2-1]